MWRVVGFFLVFLFPLVVIYLTGGTDKGPILSDEEVARRKKKLAEIRAQNKRDAEGEKTATGSSEKRGNKKKQQKKKQVEEKKEEVEEPVAVVEEGLSKRSKKNKKKATAKAVAKAEEENPVVVEQKKEEPVAESPKKNSKKKSKAAVEPTTTTTKVEFAAAVVEESKKEESVKEIDEHMDSTANYARVMRIKPEEIEDEWEAVPYEEGWNQVRSRRPHNASTSSSGIDVNAEINNVPAVANAHLDKKQRENLSRSQKNKEAKAAADKLQEERLKKHQKELEKLKIQEFYSSGKGKNTQWGKNGQKSSSKVPQSTASVNEFGQLIWD